MTALIGYARVSKADGSQVHDLQRDALAQAGVDANNVYEDAASGKKEDRPGLTACLKALRRGDTLVVWKLDRLGRDLRHLALHDGANQVRVVDLRYVPVGHHLGVAEDREQHVGVRNRQRLQAETFGFENHGLARKMRRPSYGLVRRPVVERALHFGEHDPPEPTDTSCCSAFCSLYTSSSASR